MVRKAKHRPYTGRNMFSHGIFRKLLVGLMAGGMAVSSLPVTVFAEDADTATASAETDDYESMSQTNSDGSSSTLDLGVPQAPEDSETSGEDEVNNEAEASAPPEATEEPQESADPIEEASGGDEDLKQRLTQNDELWKAEATRKPHMVLNITGAGSVTVKKENGESATYRIDSVQDSTSASDKKALEKEGTELPDYSFDISKLAAENAPDDTPIPDYIFTKDEGETIGDESYNYLKYPAYIIYGEEGEKLHVTVSADTDTKDVINNVYTDRSSTGFLDIDDEHLVSEDSQKTTYDFDFELKANEAAHTTVTFSDVTGKETVNAYEVNGDGSNPKQIASKGVAGENDMPDTATIADISSAGWSGSGYARITAKMIRDYEKNKGHLGDPAYNDTFFISRGALGNSGLAMLMDMAGVGEITLDCTQGGRCAPRDGYSYGYSYNVQWVSATKVRVYVTLDTENRSAYLDYGSGYGGLLQGGLGYFEFTAVHDVDVSVSKQYASEDDRYYAATHGLNFAGAQFYVWLDNDHQGTIVTDANGNGSIHFSNVYGQPTVVTMQETVAPNGFDKYNGGNSFTVSADNSTGLTFSAKVSERGTPKQAFLKKLDAAGNFVPGAQVEVRNGRGTLVTTLTTANGDTPFSVLPGDYTLTEVAAPDGYYVNPDPIHVTVPMNDGAVFSMTDQPIEWYVKKISNTTGNDVSGVTLRLSGPNTNGGNTELEEWQTDGGTHKLGTGTLLNGWSGKLRAGATYTITEASVPSGWELRGAYIYNSEGKQMTYYAEENRQNENILPANAKVTWNDSVQRYVVTVDGREIGIVDPYTNKVMANVVTFAVPLNPDDSRTGATENNPVEVGNQELNYGALKTDAITGKPIVGAKLQLLKKGDSKVLDEWVTDGKVHHFDSKLLQYGEDYVIHETDAPTGYYAMGADVPFTVYDTGGIERVISKANGDNLVDYPIQYEIMKLDYDTNTNLDGVTLELYDKTAGNKLVDTWVTGKNNDENVLYHGAENYDRWTHSLTYKGNGQKGSDGSYGGASIANGYRSMLIAGHTYYVKEKATVPGYYLDESVTEFTVKPTSASSTERNPIMITLRNHPIVVRTAKKNALTNEYQAGATMSIRKDDKEHTSIASWQSREEQITMDNQYMTTPFESGNTYYLTEDEAPAGFFMAASDDTNVGVAFTIPKTWQDAVNKGLAGGIEVEAYDYKIKISAWKVDSITGRAIKNVLLVLKDSKGNTVDRWRTDSLEHVIDSSVHTLIAGETYTLHEEEAPDGYYKTKDVTFTIPKVATADIVKKVTQGLPAITITMADGPIHWRVYKADDKGNLLTGTQNGDPFVFQIYHKTKGSNGYDDTPIATISTADSKYVETGYWDLGAYAKAGDSYKLIEVSTPRGWKPYEEPIEITLPDEPPTDSTTVTKLPVGKTTTELVNSNGTLMYQTQIVNSEFHAYVRKMDENNNILKSYTDAGITRYFKFNIYAAQDVEIMSVDGSGKPAAKTVYHKGDYVATVSTKDYDKNDRIDVSSKLYWGAAYRVVEVKDADTNTSAVQFDTDSNRNNVISFSTGSDKSPVGYYRAVNQIVTPTGDDNTFNIVMINPHIKARFRKDDQNGEPLRDAHFKFKLLNMKLPEGKNAVVSWNASQTDSEGYFDLSPYLEEDTPYELRETGTKYPYMPSSTPITFNTPKFYGGDVQDTNTVVNPTAKQSMHKLTIYFYAPSDSVKDTNSTSENNVYKSNELMATAYGYSPDSFITMGYGKSGIVEINKEGLPNYSGDSNQMWNLTWRYSTDKRNMIPGGQWKLGSPSGKNVGFDTTYSTVADLAKALGADITYNDATVSLYAYMTN